jgi:UDP-GlcNAc:undecaprenyl-phosphate GlcNAc-1-phosphate transferase
MKRGELGDIAEAICLIATAAAISAILTPVIMNAAKRRGFMAEPAPNRWHEKPVPIFGGVAIAVAFGIAIALTAAPTKSVLGIVAAGAIMFLLGLIDDFYPLSPLTKVLGQLAGATVLIATGTYVDFYYPYVAIPLSLVWFVGVTNAVNLVDNMDGLAAGTCAIAAAVLVMTPPEYGNMQAPIIAAALLGAVLGFLPYNLPPARVFMGDTGSQFLGITIAACAVAGTWRGASNLLVAFAAPVLLLAIPILDVVFVSIRRRKEGRSIVKGGTDHISHTLANAGLGPGRTLILLLAFSGVFAFAAWFVQPDTLSFLTALLFFLAALAVLAIILFLVMRRKIRP